MCFVGFNTHVKPHDEMLDFFETWKFLWKYLISLRNSIWLGCAHGKFWFDLKSFDSDFDLISNKNMWFATAVYFKW